MSLPEHRGFTLNSWLNWGLPDSWTNSYFSICDPIISTIFLPYFYLKPPSLKIPIPILSSTCSSHVLNCFQREPSRAPWVGPLPGTLPGTPAPLAAGSGTTSSLRFGSVTSSAICGRSPRNSGKGYGSVSKPCTPGEHQNSWDYWMFIPLNMVLIDIDP